MEAFMYQFTRIPNHTRLYTLIAFLHPWDKNGIVLGDLELTSKCVTSTYGDKKLFFRHQYIEDDVKLRPQWADAYFKDCYCNYNKRKWIVDSVLIKISLKPCEIFPFWKCQEKIVKIKGQKTFTDQKSQFISYTLCQMSTFCRFLLISKYTNSPPVKPGAYGATGHFQTEFVAFFECGSPRWPKIVVIVFLIAIGNHCLDNGIVSVEVNLTPTKLWTTYSFQTKDIDSVFWNRISAWTWIKATTSVFSQYFKSSDPVFEVLSSPHPCTKHYWFCLLLQFYIWLFSYLGNFEMKLRSLLYHIRFCIFMYVT